MPQDKPRLPHRPFCRQGPPTELPGKEGHFAKDGTFGPMEPPFPGRHQPRSPGLQLPPLQRGDGKEFNQGLSSGWQASQRSQPFLFTTWRRQAPLLLGAPVTQPNSEKPGGRISGGVRPPLHPSRVASHQAGRAYSLNTAPPSPSPSAVSPGLQLPP